MKGAAITGVFLLLAAAACVAPPPEDDSYIWTHASGGQTPAEPDAGTVAEAGESAAPFDDESVLGVVATSGLCVVRTI